LTAQAIPVSGSWKQRRNWAEKWETILATSSAAGPAFEGMGISCGLQAVSGAINKEDN